ncbi:hypothetical protein [Corallincola spongiicola]|uniref:Uncharacterized protein n=1 Tax=Corallincola spongiicola TaxID=2520508 RepID=A0ABY1WM32_9GAMM|nr:hypothetical protein [Corallincola spongiicola]TAA42654.1 hypothetical protein EXY25_15310 [Corallincola spongiicola]
MQTDESYDSLLRHEAEKDMEAMAGAHDVFTSGCFMVFLYATLTSILIVAVVGIFLSTSESWLESFFIELSAIMLFFIVSPLFIYASTRQGWLFEVCSVAAMLIFFALSYFSSGAWQPVFLELAIGLLALLGLEAVAGSMLKKADRELKQAVARCKAAEPSKMFDRDRDPELTGGEQKG